jgi:Ca2+:H+ antiporter
MSNLDLKPTNDSDITTDESEDELHILAPTKSLLKNVRKSKYKPEHTKDYQLDTLKPTIRASIYHVITYSYLNLFLVFVPCGLIVSAMRLHNQTIIFALNAIAIIPVTGLLTYATEELAQHMGVGLGALLNIVFGNLVELVILISMLGKTHFRLVKSSLLGSIFVNLLFILGAALVFAGWNKEELVFDRKRTQMLMLFVMTSILCLLVPVSLRNMEKRAC